MLKIFKAAWNVLRGRDVNSEKPIKVKGRTKKEIAAHLADLTRQKEVASDRKEPWVAMVSLDVDYNDLAKGSFELDWNDYFIAQLMRAGYAGKEDADLVDQWFTNVCRNVVLETYEQNNADPRNRAVKLGDGRTAYE